MAAHGRPDKKTAGAEHRRRKMNSIIYFINGHQEIIPFIIFFAIIIAWTVSFFYLQKKRTESLRKAAEEHGLSFSAECEPEFEEEVMKSGIDLFLYGHSREIRNIIHNMNMPYAEMNIFDYSYTTGSGKNRTVHNYTCALAKYDAKTEFPHFSLVPENFFNRLADRLFEHRDINFENYPVFSKKYLLRGNDEEAVRRLFSPSVLSSMEIKNNLSIFASGRYVLYCSSAVFIKADKIEAFAAEARENIQLLYSYLPR